MTLRTFNTLVPRVQRIKIRNLTLNRLLIVEFVKKMVHLDASGTNGLRQNTPNCESDLLHRTSQFEFNL